MHGPHPASSRTSSAFGAPRASSTSRTSASGTTAPDAIAAPAPRRRQRRGSASIASSAALLALVATPCMMVPAFAAPTTAAPAVATELADAASSDYTWSNAQIEGGGFVPGIIYNPTEEGLVYARTDIGGAYRLDRASDTWVPLLDEVGWDDWGYNGVMSLSTDPVETNRVYVAVGMYTNEWDPNNGAILRSDDYGQTWERTELPFKVGGNMAGRGIGERLVVDPADNDVLYYGAENGAGLWRSTDKGATWSQVDAFPNVGNFAPNPDSEWSYDRQEIGVLWTAFDTRSATDGGSQTIFTAVGDLEDPLYRSDDGGATWQPVEGAPTGYLAHHGQIDEVNGYLYITTSDTAGPYDGGDGEVWRYSIDDGTWTDLTPDYRPVGADFGFSGLSIDASDPDTIMVTTQIQWWPDILIFRSTDGGETWSPIWEYATDDAGNQEFVARYQQDITGVPWLTFGVAPTEPALWTEPAPKLGWMAEGLAINPFDPDEMMYGTGATIYRTSNLTDWDEGGTVLITPEAQGIEETAIQDLAAPAGDVDLLSAMFDLGGFVHGSIDEVPSMIEGPYMGGTGSVDIAGLDQSVYVRAGTDAEGAFRVAVSRDSGETWTGGATVEGATESGRAALTADGGTIIWSAAGIGVQVSTDDGQTWTAATGLPEGSAGSTAEVQADRVDPSLVYAWVDGVLSVSTDGGLSFTASAGTDADGASVLPTFGSVRIATVLGSEGEVWAAGGDKDATDDEGDGVYGLFRSLDGGVTWESFDGFDAADVVGFGAAAPGFDSQAIYVSGSYEGQRGIYRSVDGGTTWQRINDDQNQWGITDAAITGDPDVFGRVYIATNGRGIIVGDTDVVPAVPTDPVDGDDDQGDDDGDNGTDDGTDDGSDDDGTGSDDQGDGQGTDQGDGSGTTGSGGASDAGGSSDGTTGSGDTGSGTTSTVSDDDAPGASATDPGRLAVTGTNAGIAAAVAAGLAAVGGLLVLLRRRFTA
ncbi:xyloglucanase [Brachybacterium sp. DNPG3]